MRRTPGKSCHSSVCHLESYKLNPPRQLQSTFQCHRCWQVAAVMLAPAPAASLSCQPPGWHKRGTLWVASPENCVEGEAACSATFSEHRADDGSSHSSHTPASPMQAVTHTLLGQFLLEQCLQSSSCSISRSRQLPCTEQLPNTYLEEDHEL